MESQLTQFILNESFPCVMAKAVVKSGLIKTINVRDFESDVKDVLKEMYSFIDEYRQNPKKLRSFIVCVDDKKAEDFEYFEENFWKFLAKINIEDKNNYVHDPRVSSDPLHPQYSFSLKEEAFFILALHPQSPRFARRFFKPCIVFNLHQQFEQMRQKGVFSKVRDMIRLKDKLLQGSINPMLTDFGEKSEIFQYIGKVYESMNDLKLQKGFLNASY